MKIFKIFSVFALTLGVTTFAFAGNPKSEVKSGSATTSETKTSTAEVKWFHFEGAANQTGDPTKYVEVDQADLECESNIGGTYRCEIQIMSQGTTPDRPDLTSSVLAEYLKTNP